MLRGTEGWWGVTPTLSKRGVFVLYWKDSKDMHVEADTTEVVIEGDKRMVISTPALLPDKVRDFGSYGKQC